MNPAPRPAAVQGGDLASARVQPSAASSRTAGTAAPVDAEVDANWWSESADGRCSESAALFAASQAAPLTVV